MSYNVNTLEQLKRMPIFKMSLGSKELFHSNFLEYLWEEDRTTFIAMLNSLVGKDVLDQSIEYELAREKSHFDISLFHHEGPKSREIYDVVIENKLKSIPNREQLSAYEIKNENKSQNTKYILLTLMEEFHDKKDIEKTWTVINYESLGSAITKHFGERNTYIKDYCEFVKLMHSLQKDILICDAGSETLWPDKPLAYFRNARLHDLYIKLRGLQFLEILKQEINNSWDTKYVKDGGDVIRKESLQFNIFLNFNIHQGCGQVAVFIYFGEEQIFEIVIQGNQYRHCINYKRKSDGKYESFDNDNTISKAKIWEVVNNDTFMRSFIRSGGFYEKYKSKKEYCGYGADQIYRYRTIDSDESVNSLIVNIVSDVESIMNQYGVSRKSRIE